MNDLLPADEVRAAVAGEDWARALALLSGYDEALRSRLADPARVCTREDCTRLLAAHLALQQELLAARDATSAALAQLKRERRGVQAYIGAGA